MFHPLIRTLVKVAVASLIVGTILTHFGITPERLIKETGLSYERIEELARRGLSWAGPNLLVGAMVSCRSGSCSTCSGRPAAADNGRTKPALPRPAPCATRYASKPAPRPPRRSPR
jgi:hypothetical protein